jgi:hypothetical protein
MKLTVTIKASELTAAEPDSLRFGPKASLEAVLHSVLTEIDFQAEIDLYAVLDQRQCIAHIWKVEDVKSIREHLTNDEAWHVLQLVEKRLDSNYGINWDFIADVADELYPEPETGESQA